jgi:hypothetical protein
MRLQYRSSAFVWTSLKQRQSDSGMSEVILGQEVETTELIEVGGERRSDNPGAATRRMKQHAPATFAAVIWFGNLFIINESSLAPGTPRKAETMSASRNGMTPGHHCRSCSPRKSQDCLAIIEPTTRRHTMLRSSIGCRLEIITQLQKDVGNDKALRPRPCCSS